jgi:ABC-type nitrate/sulfonate/bicarbonate transport system substrate-binding protein
MQRMVRSHSLLMAWGLLCAAPLALAGTPVTLGVVTWIGYGPIYCAAANGDYKKYGLDVRLVNFADNSTMPGAVQ